VRRAAWLVAAIVATCVAVAGIAAPASADTHVPADAKICRKHDEQGSNKGTTVHLGGGRHRYNGGDGNDKIFGGPKADIINGGRGHDAVHGGGGNDVVCGGVGNDRVPRPSR
jgi:Ca2+-binding RTX toxin-like protein